MTNTTKPTRLAKIWREIKRPFRRMKESLLRLAYRKAAKKRKVFMAEPEATAFVVQSALGSYEFVEKLLESKPRCPYKDQETWNAFFVTDPTQLKKLQDKLVAGLDELSHEVVNRYIARRLFASGFGAHSTWNVISRWLGLVYLLDFQEQKRLISLGEAYKCPYKFPEHAYCCNEHMAVGFGLNQFPPEIQRKVIGKDIIDDGGFSGDSAMIFTEYDPRRVYTFEPNPDTIPAMKDNLAANATVLGGRKERIEIIPLALGKSKGTLTFFSEGEFDGGATTWSGGASGKIPICVNVTSIDEFVKEQSLNVGLIKLDVEGAEYDTILGAQETILKQKPLLIISIYHTLRDFFEIKPLIESWGVGYKFEIRQHQHPREPDNEFVLLAY